MKESKCYGFIGFIALTILGCSPDPAPPRTDLDDQPARMVSAFFGLDNAMQALRYKGADGMPVTFSKRVADPDSLEPEMFTVISRSGKRVHPLRVTTRPADETSKRHSVLLIGEFGNEPDDPPAKVKVTGQLILAGGDNAQGLSVDVTPLTDGPSLVLAYAVSPEDLPDDDVPPETKQVVVAIWNGGVTPMEGVIAENHRLGYSVEIENGSTVQPIGIGDIGGDNYEYLYLDTEETALRVNIKSGLLMDPRGDVNLVTIVEVAAPNFSHRK
jgi:guanyl-specific ribonuclease Sa